MDIVMTVFFSDFRKRTRPPPKLAVDILEQRALLEKTWSRYKMQDKLRDFQQIDKVVMAQQKALQELRFESEQLYEAAVQLDVNLLPFQAQGPVATPPIDRYESPDGEYVNVSKKWDK